MTLIPLNAAKMPSPGAATAMPARDSTSQLPFRRLRSHVVAHFDQPGVVPEKNPGKRVFAHAVASLDRIQNSVDSWHVFCSDPTPEDLECT